MNPYPTGRVTAAALALITNPHPSEEAHFLLSPYVRDPIFEHAVPITLDDPSCYRGGGLCPPPIVAEWLADNLAGAWSLYLDGNLKAWIAFELDADRVLYRIRFAE